MELKIIVTVFAVFLCIQVNCADPEPWTTKGRLSALLNDQFGDNRHHVTNPEGKREVVKFLRRTFKSYNLQTVESDFRTDDPNYRGVNVVGLWPGRLTGTPLDRPIILTAHYDSPRGLAAVDDNGSGLAALVEAARLITSQPCMQQYTVVFVALDLEIQESPDRDQAACYTGYCGSREFVGGMMQYLKELGIELGNMNGVIILDSILNYNNTEGSQTIPQPEIYKETPGLKESYESIEQDGFRGDFIMVVGRQEYDYPLYSAFHDWWDDAGQDNFKRQSALIPLKDVVSAVEATSDPHWQVYQTLIKDDLKSFWNASTDIKAMLLTDTIYLRGRQTPNRGVYDRMTLTQHRLGFLKKITDVVTRTIMDLADFKDDCKDPMIEAPDAFKAGLKMFGTIAMPNGQQQNINVTIDEFTSSGGVKATVTSGWELKLQGRFNADDYHLGLRLKAPSSETFNCAVSGHLHELDSRVLFIGEVNGQCSDHWPHQILTMIVMDKPGFTGLYPSTTTGNLRSLLTDHFGDNRHHVTNPTGKAAAADFIYSTFKSYGLQVYRQGFTTDNRNYQGRNVIAIWPGTQAFTTRDKPVILGAHYDTWRNYPGVDDNGSGLAALMEAARIISSQPCIQEYSVVFAAFDFKCGEPSDVDRAACFDGMCGSKNLVNHLIEPLFDLIGLPPTSIQGVIIMESILNYNNTPGSQTFPEQLQDTPGVQLTYEETKEDGFRGNFVGILAREEYDLPLYSAFYNRWDEAQDPQYKRRDMLVPYKHIADVIETTSDPHWQMYNIFFNEDIKSFWRSSSDIMGMVLSDTIFFRHREIERPGRYDKMPLTDDRLRFLKKITNVVTRTAMDLSGAKGLADCKAAVPVKLTQGIQLEGKVTLSDGQKDYRLSVKPFVPNGRVEATLTNGTWSIDIAGHYDPDALLLVLRVPEPKDIDSLACVMYGHLVESGSSVRYSGVIDDTCSPGWPDGRLGFTFDSSTGVHGGRNGGFVVIGLVVGVALTILVAAAAWFIRKRLPQGGVTGLSPIFRPLQEET